MPTFEFEFNIEDKVKTPFDTIGFITMLCVDDSKEIQYFVKTKEQDSWYKENQLEPVNKL